VRTVNQKISKKGGTKKCQWEIEQVPGDWAREAAVAWDIVPVTLIQGSRVLIRASFLAADSDGALAEAWDLAEDAASGGPDMVGAGNILIRRK
jgi:hypothetical protein